MNYTGIFERTSILLSDEKIEKLQNSKILVAGVGGVGSFACEALARAGINNIKIIDADVVEKSNLNRQLVALNSTIGKSKAIVMKDRILDINPKCKVEVLTKFIRPDDMDDLFTEHFDYVIDAIDSLSCKVAFIKIAHEKNYKVISSMGAGGKLDPTKIKVDDIYKTEVCPLARVIRTRLKRQKVKKGILSVYSTEKNIPPLQPKESLGDERERATNGTISYLPALFGLTIAGIVIKNIVS